MVIGVPKEIKPEENRIAIVPGGVETIVHKGHTVIIEQGAGLGSGFIDEDYIKAGARVVQKHEDVFAEAELLLKVKEPLPEEYNLLRERQIIFTYLHLAASEELTRNLQERKIIGIAYETVQTEDGFLPLLAPMSEIAGRMAPQEGAKYLEETYGGRGILLGGVAGVPPANVVIFGGGNVGYNAA
ncbi:MAG: alanine dehydrogenase, partial [Nitrospirota bacterium]|nr:alanine dehydrogenase [Nitrospirota bacterium]